MLSFAKRVFSDPFDTKMVFMYSFYYCPEHDFSLIRNINYSTVASTRMQKSCIRVTKNYLLH